MMAAFARRLPVPKFIQLERQSMLRHATIRILIAVPTLLAIVTLAFFMMRLAPGGPFDAERRLPPEIEANLKAAYDLDKPILDQYVSYIQGLLKGDLGPSFTYRDFSVSELVASGIPVSLSIGATALCLALFFGCIAGVIAAYRHDRPSDIIIMGFAMTGIVIPVFVMAPLLALVFGVYAGLLPVAGWQDGAIANRVLPSVALALPFTAVIARLMRGSMLEVMQSEFMRTAIAKGVPAWQVPWRHGFRTAFMPVLSYLGPAAAGIITGSVVIEQIFAIPGIGRYFVEGALNRDYTLVLGVAIFYAALIILFNLIVDIFYRILDPKVDLAR